MVANRPDLVIGCGAGFAGDRFDAALPVIEALSSYDCPRFLIYEVLAERTLAIAQKLKLADPDKGYSPWLEKYLTAALPLCLANNIRIVQILVVPMPPLPRIAYANWLWNQQIS